MAKFADVHCPNCGHKGALVMKEDIINPNTKKKYDEVQCDSCGQIFRVEHSWCARGRPKYPEFTWDAAENFLHIYKNDT